MFTNCSILNNFGIKISRLCIKDTNRTITNQKIFNNPMIPIQNPSKNLKNSLTGSFKLNSANHKFVKRATFFISYLKYFFIAVHNGCDISEIACFTSWSRFRSKLKTAIIRINIINSQRVIVEYPKVFFESSIFFSQKSLKWKSLDNKKPLTNVPNQKKMRFFNHRS